MRNRLVNVSDERLEAFLAFGRAHPEIVARDHLLQKLAIFEFVAPIVQANPHEEMLEIGCGLGFHAALLSHHGRVQATELAAPGSFVGISEAVDRRREVVLRELARGEVGFRHNDGRTIPWPERSFDLVFHNSVIEHVPDPTAFNREVLRVLRPGGVAVCITGTPTLCAHRLLKDWLLALPGRAAKAALREVVLAGRVPGVAERARAALAPEGDASAGVDRAGLRALYPRLQHCITSPAYNRPVLEALARERGCTPEELGAAVHAHLAGSGLERVLFSLTPETHGQHYRHVLEEMAEWRLSRWREKFDGAGLPIEEVRPYRFHHLFELTPRRRWNGRAFFLAAPWIRAFAGALPASAASEVIIVARRPA